MKNNITLISNILILFYAIIICYLSINGLIDNSILHLGISLGMLILISVTYIKRKITRIEVISIILNILLSGICIYLLVVLFQLDVRN
ncbi:hypothetical protein SAMN05216324_11054 [Chryseobacterium limigenitum]|uniref:Uncharacterized protein n=1 Tax=Chryseobacterium limigenitum TaxID=1612149 RepID=A0A1K2IT53_9FLAO|nr:hypothetical protein SAMN05216324_11054 [Chryseobacterium limigenitum]